MLLCCVNGICKHKRISNKVSFQAFVINYWHRLNHYLQIVRNGFGLTFIKNWQYKIFLYYFNNIIGFFLLALYCLPLFVNSVAHPGLFTLLFLFVFFDQIPFPLWTLFSFVRTSSPLISHFSGYPNGLISPTRLTFSYLLGVDFVDENYSPFL